MNATGTPQDDRYAAFARYYDREHAAHADDLDFIHAFAEQANGPVLELGCGSGRALAALADTDLELTGIDNSAAMLRLARERLGERATLVECAMEALGTCEELRRDHYWFAFAALNTFLHLPDADAHLRTLEGLRAVVVSGGLLLLDLLVPDPVYLAGLDGRVVLEWTTTLPDGDRLDKWAARSHDLASQTIETTVFFDRLESGSGTLNRTVDTYLTRYIHVFELEHLLERAGWRVISLFGGYDLSSFSSESDRMIALATWGAP